MRHTSVVCPACKELVEVTDKTIAQHGDCRAGGTRYVPSYYYGGGVGASRLELIATAHLDSGADAALFRVHAPDPTVN